MPQQQYQQGPLPSFVSLRTSQRMTAVATNLALARKAIKEIAKIERILDATVVDKSDLRLAMEETSRFAKIVVNSMTKALSGLRDVRARVKSYQGNLSDAID